MPEFNNTQFELLKFRSRLVVALGFVLFCFVLLLARFVWLQIFKHNEYALKAENNRTSISPVTPTRGLIFDRNGVLLVANYATYMLEITPSKLDAKIEDVVARLGKVVEISKSDMRRFKRTLADVPKYENISIRSRLSDEEIARFTAQRFRFPGVEIKARLLREYPLGEVASHVLGYVGRINARDQIQIDESGDAENYKGTDYIGKTGIEKSYEQQLHGKTGFELIEVRANGRAVRTLTRQDPVPGSNLVLSIDVGLQQVVEKAFSNRNGALIAIEPKTGDVLAYVSMPNYNPNLFVDGIDQQNWDALNTSPDHPLLDRALRGTFAPGSTYKPFMALAALELGYRTPASYIHDQGVFMLGNHRFRDDVPGGHGVVDLRKSIVVSCDTFYYILANDMGVDTIHNFMNQFGFGQKTGIDLEGEKIGILPSTDWKRRSFKSAETQKWYQGETISLGIGQGYNAFTPLQIANAVAILANDGIVMKPHLVKIIENPLTGKRDLMVSKESYTIKLQQKNINFVKNAMVGVTADIGGTAHQAFLGADYISGGKTGTAQVVGIKQNQKYNASSLHKHLRDNGLYIAFAPAENPKIAVAVIVENEGWGGKTAAPIARVALDYYLNKNRTDATNAQVQSLVPDIKAKSSAASSKQDTLHLKEN